MSEIIYHYGLFLVFCILGFIAAMGLIWLKQKNIEKQKAKIIPLKPLARPNREPYNAETFRK